MSALTRATAAAMTAAVLTLGVPVAVASPATECATLYPKSATARKLCETRLELRDQRKAEREQPRKPFVTKVTPTGESPLDREQRLQERRDERNRNRLLTIGGILAVLAVVGGGAWLWSRPRPAHAAPAAPVYAEQPTYEYPAYAEQSEQSPPPMPDYGTYAAQTNGNGFADAAQTNPESEPSPPHGGGRFDDMI